MNYSSENLSTQSVKLKYQDIFFPSKSYWKFGLLQYIEVRQPSPLNDEVRQPSPLNDNNFRVWFGWGENEYI